MLLGYQHHRLRKPGTGFCVGTEELEHRSTTLTRIPNNTNKNELQQTDQMF